MSRYQLLPPLSDEEYAALRDDIAGAGVRVPIDVDEDGNILDGHHRKQIADELGKECPERIVRGLPEFAKVDYALTVNLTRRHLTREQRRDLVTKSLKRDPRVSDREHARRCGVSHTYVSGVREALEAADQLATVASRVGKDGRERPSQTAGLAGPAPDAEQASAASGTAAAGDRVGSPAAAPQDPSGAFDGFSGTEETGEGATEPDAGGGAGTPPPATDHPGSSSPGEGAGSAPAPAAGGAASTSPLAAPNSPSEVQRPGTPAGTGEPTEDAPPVRPPAGDGVQGGPATSPAGPPCEKCGDEILPGQAAAGYKRCDDCDPEGDHQADDSGECGRCKTHCPTCEQPLP